MTKAICAAAALFTIATVPAFAAMPDYDPVAYCKEVASVGGALSQSTLNSCLEMEQADYNQLKPMWDALPASMRSYCDQVARVGGSGSYSTLNSCIEMEQKAAQENGQFKFQK